jgi:hypothetical protein
LSSYRTANSRPANSKAEESSCGGGGGELHSAHSVDSLNSLSYAESFKTGKSPPFEEDDPFMTPTNTEAHFFLLDEAGNGGNDFDRAQTPTAGVRTIWTCWQNISDGSEPAGVQPSAAGEPAIG